MGSSLNGSTNDSMKNSPIISPKITKADSNNKEEESRQYLMKKKSPMKAFDDKPEVAANSNTSVNYTGSNLLKNEQYAKNDRNNRLDLLLKNHAKLAILNQMILDMFKIDHQRSVYMAYYLFKGIEKETSVLSESLKKELSSDFNVQDSFREFRAAVEKEADSVKANLFLVREAVDEDGEFKINELETRRQEIIKGYLEGVRLTN